MENTEKKNKLKALLIEEKKPKVTSRRATPKPTIQITGSSNIHIVGGDINHNTTTVNHFNTEKVIHRPKIEVKTGDGVISAAQKARLQQLVKDWIEIYDAVHVKKKSFGAAWGAVNKRADVNSYHEIPAEKFEAIEKWLLVQIGIKNSMPSAKKKSTTWRNGRIKGIQSRCNELGIQDKRKEYMKKTFGQDSLTLLSDDDVDKVYRWVMSKK
jgi:hypothetical protein